MTRRTAEEFVCLVSGGTVVTVRGTDLDSVAEPRINVTVVATTFHNVTYSTTTVNFTVSKVGYQLSIKELV